MVQGRTIDSSNPNAPKKCLVSKLFDVCPRSTLEEMEHKEEVRVAWGTGIAGHVAESGEPVNISDAYQVNVVFFLTFVAPLVSTHNSNIFHIFPFSSGRTIQQRHRSTNRLPNESIALYANQRFVRRCNRRSTSDQ